MEAMAIESLVASAWKLDEFLAVVRHPVKLANGQYGDIDVIGVNASGVVRIAECKVRGKALSVNVETKELNWSALPGS